MKLKIVVVDFEIPPRLKQWGLRLGIPLAVLLGGGAVAYGAALVSWSEAQTLTAKDLNANFGNLDARLTTLEARTGAEVKATQSMTWSGASNAWSDVTNITLTPGTWDISAIGIFYGNGVSSMTAVDLGISSNLGNVSTGLVRGDNWAMGTFRNGTNDQGPTLVVPQYRVTVSSSTIYYLKGKVVNPDAQSTFYGRISAVSVAGL